PNAVVLTNINLQADNIALKDNTANFHIENSSFKEISGLDLKALSLSFHADDNTLKVENLITALNNNRLEADMRLDYPALSKLMEVPEQSKVNVNIPTFQVSLNDIFLIQPELKKNHYLNTLSKKSLTGNLQANGYLSNINMPKMNVNWGKSTSISANGNIQNITET